MLRNLAVIVDFAYPEPCGSPLDTPFGMFAKDLEQEGIKIILTPLTGFTKSDSPIAKGWTVEGDSWRAAELPVAGCYNRVDWKPRFEDYCRVRRLFSESNTPFVNYSDCRALFGPKARLIVEVGLDIVADGTGIPYLIEINDTPKGRLKTLLRQTANPLILDAHKRAISNPLLYLNDVLTTSTAN